MEIFVNVIQLSFKAATIIMSLDISKFLQRLDGIGYKAVQRGQLTGSGMQIKDGDVALKNDVIININQQSQVVAITGISSAGVLAIFKEIRPIITECGLNADEEIAGYSVIADYVIDTDKNPQETIEKFLPSENTAIKEIDSIFGLDSSQHSLTLRPKNGKITDDEYYFVKIEPFQKRLGNAYAFQYSERSKDENKILDRFSTINNLVSKTIETIER